MTPATPQVSMDKKFMTKKVYTYIAKKTTYKQTNQASVIIVIVRSYSSSSWDLKTFPDL